MARSNETAHYTSSPARTRLAHQNRARFVFFIEEEYNGGLLIWEAHTSALRRQEDIYARHPMMFISEAIHLACYITRGGLLRCNGSPNVNLAKQDFEVMPGPSGDAAAIRCQGRRNETSRVCWARLEGRRTSRPLSQIGKNSGHLTVLSSCSDNRVLAFYAHLERSAASSSHYYYYFFFYNSPSKHAGVNLEMYSFANYLLEMSRVTSFCWGGKLITLSAYKKHWAAACTRRSELFLSDIIWKHRWLSTW